MVPELDQQKDISLASAKISLASDTLDNSTISHLPLNQHSAIKSKISNSLDKIRKNKKHADLNEITEHILKTETSN